MHSAAARLTAFALVLFGAFGTAYAAGEHLPGHSHSGTATHTHNFTPQPATISAQGFHLVLEAKPDAGATLTFHIDGPGGAPVTQFLDNHGSLLHTVLIRPDLSGFQHVHPTIDAAGSWTVPMPPGKWHLVFDTEPAGLTAPIVLATNYDDEHDVAPVALPAADDSPTVDGLTVARDGLTFTVTDSSGAAASGLEPYLGQPAHLIAMRQGDLAYTHLHPNPTVTTGTPVVTVATMPGMDMGSATAAPTAANVFTFAGSLSVAGTYRLFLQFGHHGDVVTVPYTVVVP